ncbi:MAG: hypothetical protein ABSA71_17175 [Desulfomonilia bacterium]|jgi:hypothetical protein
MTRKTIMHQMLSGSGFMPLPNLQSAAHVPMPGFVRHHDLLHSWQDCFGDEYGIDNEEFR